jgi:predicted nicotinamide N-methyase
MATRSWPAHLAHVQFPRDDAHLFLARSDEDDVTGIYQWPAGAGLASYLLTSDLCAGKRVLDLGCGRGALGFTALLRNAQHVIFADNSPVVCDLLTRTLEINEASQNAEVLSLNWGEPFPLPPCDLVLGGDILYRPKLFPALATTIASALTEHGQVYLSDPRENLEANLPAIFAAAGLRLTSERLERFTLLRGRSIRAA